MTTCTKRGCGRRTFMDTDRCFDHQQDIGTAGCLGLAAWTIFCALLGLATLVFFGWVIYELVTWVTR